MLKVLLEAIRTRAWAQNAHLKPNPKTVDEFLALLKTLPDQTVCVDDLQDEGQIAAWDAKRRGLVTHWSDGWSAPDYFKLKSDGNRQKA